MRPPRRRRHTADVQSARLRTFRSWRPGSDSVGPVHSDPMNWQPVFDEALDIFVRYLQIDTSNPPGNEKPAARFLGSLIEREGIAVEYIETAPNREVAVATLKGDGSKRSLMLCNHTDV